MIDPRAEAVLLRSAGAEGGGWQDRTAEVGAYRVDGDRTLVRFGRSDTTYRYGVGKVLVLRRPQQAVLSDGMWVEVHGRRIRDATAAYRFSGSAGTWVRIFWGRGAGEAHRLFPEQAVRISGGVEQTPRAADVMAYWRKIVAALPVGKDGPNPLQYPYSQLGAVHPDSVLARYLRGEPIGGGEPCAAAIFPFSSNVSQRSAVETALRSPVSVIEGPPGTGKTQTILNIIASLIAQPGLSVGVVAFSNSAVDNVREKLEKAGVGYTVANLGREEKRREFYGGQAARNSTVEEMLAAPPAEPPDPVEVTALGRELESLQRSEWALAALRRDAAAHRLEREHFEEFLRGQTAPDLGGLPLLRRSSSTMLDLLAEMAVEMRRPRGFQWFRDLRRWFKYGSLRGLRAETTDVVLALQRAFYDRRIEELDAEIAAHEQTLRDGDLRGLLGRHRELSVRVFHAGLRQRYQGRRRVEHPVGASRRDFRTFSADYPVILSTCHSLRGSIGEDQLLDYLIIDEASQADLLTSALALASCRRVVVVGDERQLPPIIEERAAEAAAPPAAPYDYRSHSILSALRQLYGEQLPVTLLREHYRCDPAIIDFCNEKFYGGQLIPLKPGPPAERPMVLVRTAEGNHMRQFSDGGRVNQREIDVIVNEVLPELCAGVPGAEIGITTPYRRQGDQLTTALRSRGIESDTVHKYQGREKRVVIMSAVLDDTASGRRGVQFADDARLVNVAVSRASERFILVTGHRMLPTSRNLRDLMGYIRYRDPAQLVDSAIVSVFDLLYRDYSARLRPLAERLRGDIAQRSEDIVWTVVRELLDREPYLGFKAVPQVLLRHLVPAGADLSEREAEFVRRGSSVDILVYNGITRVPLLAIEVDGFAFHADSPVQRARDALKDRILGGIGLPLLRLPTTGSGEAELIKAALDRALERTA
ncbi:AAA domain-containing protein [Sinomonas sp. P10A9]|uniref:AAA domain-containing protein n=1 Tax=Sinomonas puerhi TaxID=3238584 RepID=A0AB39L7P9_9MICC